MENKGIRVVGHRLREYKYLVNKKKKVNKLKKKKMRKQIYI